VIATTSLELEETLQALAQQLGAIAALLGASTEPIAPETAHGLATILDGLCGHLRPIHKEPFLA
jgi:hypothetical protein